MTTISVVIPARDSQGTIRVTIDSLWNQTLRPDEVLVVVGADDYTKTAIQDYITSGFVTMVTVNPPADYIRDAQWKRWMGVKISKGDLIFLTDSKVVLEPHALENALRLMQGYGVMVVGGITPAWPDQAQNFWAKLHDKALVSNLPIFPHVSFLTKQNFGKTESLPVTTALMFTRSVFKDVSEDFALEFSKIASTYDDYVLSWLIAKAGYTILVTNQVVAHHLHRICWKDYSKQIARSGQSAAIMARMYLECPFGKRRMNQVNLITLVISLCTAFSLLTIAMFRETAIILYTSLILVGYMFVGAVNVIKAKDWQAIAFPFFTVLLILTFALHFTKTYTQTELRPSAVLEYLQIH
jgi:hypothetical protein